MSSITTIENTYVSYAGTTAKADKTSDDSFKKLLDNFMNPEGLNSEKINTPKGGLLDRELVLPSMENLEKISDRLSYIMDVAYAREGIPAAPPVELRYSYSKNEIIVKGDREDIDKISELVNGNDDLKEAIRSTMAISSHVVAIQESLQFQQEYMNSSDPERVVSKYSHLFNDNRKYPESGLRYGSSLEVLSGSSKVYETGSGSSGEYVEIKAMIVRIKEMMEEIIAKGVADEEDEEEKSGNADSGAADDNKKMSKEEYEYQQLLLRIERQREEALDKYGTDKNKYAFAVQGADDKEEYEVENPGESGTADDEQNGDGLNKA